MYDNQRGVFGENDKGPAYSSYTVLMPYIILLGSNIFQSAEWL
jgi:hypothetical protein